MARMPGHRRANAWACFARELRKHALRGLAAPSPALVGAWARLSDEERRLAEALLHRVERQPSRGQIFAATVPALWRRVVARKTDYGPPKTKAGARTLRLPSWVVTALTREHARRPDEGACFRDRHGRALTLKQLEYHWHKLVRAFPPDLPAITFHDLRHVNATMALAAGVGPNTLKQRLGHSSIRMTLDRYGHITDMLDADAADQIGGIFESDD